MKLKQLIAFVLILLMLLSILCACGDSKGGEESTPEETTADQAPPKEEESTTDQNIVCGSDKPYIVKIFGGDGPSGSGSGFHCDDIYIPEYGESNQIAAAVYARNQKMEEDFNCRIELVLPSNSGHNILGDLKRAYENGTAYDLTVLPSFPLASAATQGLLRDLNTAEALDLKNPSFDQNAVKQLALANKLYFVSGDMNATAADNLDATIVNLELFEEKKETFAEVFGDPDYADIFRLVEEHRWTVDTMLTMAEYTNYDAVPNDGKLDYQKGDTVGYFRYLTAPLAYFYGMGGRITEQDESGDIAFAIDGERSEQVLSYLYRNMVEDWIPNGASAYRKTWFYSGHCLFTEMNFGDIRKGPHLNDPVRYAVLPIALYEDGDAYQSLIQIRTNSFLWSIPTQGTQHSGLLMMLFATYSTQHTVEAYRNVVLYEDMVDSVGQQKAWEIIRQSFTYDVATLYDWGGFISIIKQADLTTQNRIQLKLQRIDDIQKSMQQTIEQFKNPVYVPLTEN